MSSTGASSSALSSTTTKSKLKGMDPGQEHTGRWTREEHEAFLQALQQYGKEWKKVAAKVKTRTVVQTRTHAQKYFQKLQKGITGEKEDVEEEVLSEAKKILPIASAKKGRSANGMEESSKKAKKKHERSSSVAAMSSQNHNAMTQAVAQLMAQMKGQKRSTTDVNKCSNITSSSKTPLGTSTDHSSYARDTPVSTDVFSNKDLFATPISENSHTAHITSSSMKIIAPIPDQTLKKNMFPEPSPAACGKRKAAEIAVAQMLVGVSGAGDKSLIARQSTPPPEKDFVHPNDPRPSSSSNAASLHIINPDTLLCNEQGNVRNLGQEPVTPWDTQLQALDSEVKGKSDDVGADIQSSNQDGPEQSMNRSALHVAVCRGMYEEAQEALSKMSSNRHIINSLDKYGFSPLHAAVVLTEEAGDVALKISRLLLSFGADVTIKDSFGNTPLHWAARVGNISVMEVLVYESCDLDVQNDMGETPLHWAMRSGRIGTRATTYLLSNGSRSSVFSKSFQRPLDVAGEGFVGLCDDLFPVDRPGGTVVIGTESSEELTEIKRQTRANFFLFSPQARTLILHHPECLEHLTKNSTDWESPDRVNAILKSVLDKNNQYVRDYEIQISTDFERASLEFLGRVHSAEYLTFVNNLSKELEKRQKAEDHSKAKNIPSIIPFTPMVQRTILREPSIKISAHSDTSFSSGSLRAARRAAGAVKHAVDCVLVGRNRNAFCITRPPGHHAGINGLLDGGDSCGFCIFNNIAAGAMHALSDENHRPKCERCAIVDIDVHHGNGTEEIVKSCDHPGRLFFFSVHLFDNDENIGKSNGFRFYPGTGCEDDVAHNIINVPLAPLWKSESSPLRTPPQGNRHGSCQRLSKSKTLATTESCSNDVNSNSMEDQQSNKLRQPTTSPPLQQVSLHSEEGFSFSYGSGRDAYRRCIVQRLLPSLRAFNPDLILVSVGFDACKGDVGNARHCKNGQQIQGIDLEPDDYAWTTRKIMEVADICCHGRVVTVLEGGYGSANESSNENSLLDKGMISECAMRHLQALIDPHNVERRRSD